MPSTACVQRDVTAAEIRFDLPYAARRSARTSPAGVMARRRPR